MSRIDFEPKNDPVPSSFGRHRSVGYRRVIVQGYDAILLDAGGVLLLPEPEAIRAALAPFGVAPDDAACHRAHYLWVNELDRLGGVYRAVMDEMAAAALGVVEDQLAEAARALAPLPSISAPAPGVLEALRLLEQTGVTLGIVSNSDGALEQRLHEYGVCSLSEGVGVRMAVIVDSGVVGIEKPDPGIFIIALDALCVPPDRVLYVGDTVSKDVHGARAAGLHPVHLDPYGLCSDDSHQHIDSLAAVAVLVH
jgi:putative hydrolase of the HAD superfamily